MLTIREKFLVIVIQLHVTNYVIITTYYNVNNNYMYSFILQQIYLYN